MHRQSLVLIVLVFAGLVVIGCLDGTKKGNGPIPPAVTITQIPPRGEGEDSQGNIAGSVTGVAAPEKYKIVIYTHTNQWYVQPLIDAPYTPINEDGTWSNWTHLGYRYAALLVRPSFQPKATLLALPQVGGDVIAKVEVAAQ